MRFVQGIGDLNTGLNRLADRQRPAAQTIGERLTVEQLHHQKVVADVEERADVRMGELRDRFRLPLEADLELHVAGEFGRKNLDRHRPIQPRVPRPVHLPHPARPDRRDDLVRPKARAGSHCHREG